MLPLLMRLDQTAAIAAPLWPAESIPRLLALLLVALLLGLMLWQWQQVWQALWLLGRSEARVAATTPFSAAELEARRLSLGLPLLLPPSLRLDSSSPDKTPPAGAPLTPPSSIARSPLPVEPEQASADDKGNELDEPIA